MATIQQISRTAPAQSLLGPARSSLSVGGGGLGRRVRALLDVLGGADASVRWVVSVRWAALAVILAALMGLHAAVLQRRSQEFAAMFLVAATGAWLALGAARRRDQAARAEAFAATGRVLSALSHELATPLSTLALTGGELAARARDRRDEELAALGDAIAGEARRAADLSALMLGVARAGAVPRAMDAAPVVREAAGRELDRLAFRGERRIEAQEPAGVLAVPAALDRVVANLVANAARAAQASASPSVDVRVQAMGDGVRIAVVDNGPGIDRAVISRLGEPLRTGHALSGGTGLGLYASALLADRMGGRLRIESSPAGGTRAVLELPGAPGTRS